MKQVKIQIQGLQEQHKRKLMSAPYKYSFLSGQVLERRDIEYLVQYRPEQFFIGTGVVMRVGSLPLNKAIKFSGTGKIGSADVEFHQEVFADPDLNIPLSGKGKTNKGWHTSGDEINLFYGKVYLRAPNMRIDEDIELAMVEYLRPIRMVKK